MRQVLICISGPSGVGKGTLVRELMKEDPTLSLSVSATTRKPRRGEEEGREYFFLSREQFEKGIRAGEFIEYDDHFGNLYGTPKGYVEAQIAAGKSVILEIDVVGTLSVKERRPDCVTIFIAPPSPEALDKRLLGRGSESEEQIRERKARAEYEYELSKKYDHIVINDVFADALKELRAIIEQEKQREV